jgi:hypothetical protein
LEKTARFIFDSIGFSDVSVPPGYEFCLRLKGYRNSVEEDNNNNKPLIFIPGCCDEGKIYLLHLAALVFSLMSN